MPFFLSFFAFLSATSSSVRSRLRLFDTGSGAGTGFETFDTGFGAGGAVSEGFGGMYRLYSGAIALWSSFAYPDGSCRKLPKLECLLLPLVHERPTLADVQSF